MQVNYSMSEQASSPLVPPYDTFTDIKCAVVIVSHHTTTRAIGPKLRCLPQVKLHLLNLKISESRHEQTKQNMTNNQFKRQ